MEFFRKINKFDYLLILIILISLLLLLFSENISTMLFDNNYYIDESEVNTYSITMGYFSLFIFLIRNIFLKSTSPIIKKINLFLSFLIITSILLFVFQEISDVDLVEFFDINLSLLFLALSMLFTFSTGVPLYSYALFYKSKPSAIIYIIIPIIAVLISIYLVDGFNITTYMEKDAPFSIKTSLGINLMAVFDVMALSYVSSIFSFLLMFIFHKITRGNVEKIDYVFLSTSIFTCILLVMSLFL